MSPSEMVYQFCLYEYQYYIKSHEKYKNDKNMADWYIAKANAYAQVMRYIELILSS